MEFDENFFGVSSRNRRRRVGRAERLNGEIDRFSVDFLHVKMQKQGEKSLRFVRPTDNSPMPHGTIEGETIAEQLGGDRFDVEAKF